MSVKFSFIFPPCGGGKSGCGYTRMLCDILFLQIHTYSVTCTMPLDLRVAIHLFFMGCTVSGRFSKILLELSGEAGVLGDACASLSRRAED